MTELTGDATLVQAPTGDEADVLSELYERYFDGVYDLAVHTLRDAEAAADVAQNTFVKAWAALRKGDAPENAKAWLYTIARNTALDECRRRQRFVRPAASDADDGEPLDFMVVDESRFSDPQGALDDKELVQLVWGCAASLSPKDYTLLDLHLRQGLGPDELASALHVSKGNMYTMLSRLRDSLGEAVSVSLLVRRGRQDCEQLDAILSNRGVELTAELRRAVQRHLRGCERCGDNQRHFVAPVEIFAGLAPLAALPAVRLSIWQGVQAQMATGRAPRQPNSSSVVMTVVAAVAAVAVIAALVLGRGLARRAGSPQPVRDPENFASTSHVIAQPSAEGIVVLTWTPRRDARRYATLWSHPAKDLPAAVVDLDGGATGTSSPRLAPGVWYFHLRTQGLDGRWTSTVHLGPFVILADAATAAPAEPGITMAPSSAGTPQPVSTGSSSPTPLAGPSTAAPAVIVPTQAPASAAETPVSSGFAEVTPAQTITLPVPTADASAIEPNVSVAGVATAAPVVSVTAIASRPGSAPVSVPPATAPPAAATRPASVVSTLSPISTPAAKPATAVTSPSTALCGLLGGPFCVQTATPTCGSPGTANPCTQPRP